MEEKELTRLEMATLLFVNDRQHSQLMDLMPEKSGMTGHSKDLFEPTLKDVSNYKAPNFEPGGGLQQGTYVPKGGQHFLGQEFVEVMGQLISRSNGSEISRRNGSVISTMNIQ